MMNSRYGCTQQVGGKEIPSPLVIFGYGSLCWKPDTTLESFESFPGYVRGWYNLTKTDLLLVYKFLEQL